MKNTAKNRAKRTARSQVPGGYLGGICRVGNVYVSGEKGEFFGGKRLPVCQKTNIKENYFLFDANSEKILQNAQKERKFSYIPAVDIPWIQRYIRIIRAKLYIFVVFYGMVQ